MKNKKVILLIFSSFIFLVATMVITKYTSWKHSPEYSERQKQLDTEERHAASIEIGVLEQEIQILKTQHEELAEMEAHEYMSYRCRIKRFQSRSDTIIKKELKLTRLKLEQGFQTNPIQTELEIE